MTTLWKYKSPQNPNCIQLLFCITDKEIPISSRFHLIETVWLWPLRWLLGVIWTMVVISLPSKRYSVVPEPPGEFSPPQLLSRRFKAMPLWWPGEIPNLEAMRVTWMLWICHVREFENLSLLEPQVIRTWQEKPEWKSTWNRCKTKMKRVNAIDNLFEKSTCL